MLKHVLDYWLPSRCVLCGLSGGELCSGCEVDLHVNTHCCPRCALPLPPALHGHECGRCIKRPPPFDAAFSPWVYDYPIDGLIRRLKFARELDVGRLLSERMAQMLLDVRQPLPDALVPVPLSAQRFRERGFNQAAEVTRVLHAKLGLQVLHDRLKRTRHTDPQTELSRTARRRNVRGAFAWLGAKPPRHVALVDDVMTTGETLRACASVLRASGATTVSVWVLARA